MVPKRSFDEIFNTNDCEIDLTNNLLETIFLPTAPQQMPNTKAPKRTFEEMFNTDDCEIDFTENLPDNATFLAIPEPTDKLSLAIHTNYAKAPQTECDSITEAKGKMSPVEVEQFNAWFTGATMSNINWEHNQKFVRPSEDEEAHFNQQVRAIREIYHNPNITRENAYWFMSNFGYTLPLIKAVAIVRVTQQKYLHEREALTEMEFAELETARSILRATKDILQKRQRRVELDDTLREKHPALEWVVRLSHKACRHIQAQVHAIDEKVMEYKERLESMGFSGAKE
ncbi:hypothetical protein N7463_001473 [Penicillium fimorum]|uniref:Uncharacterized protein n=1 Tax=Penicillium fimorum TaxID=1882269 RepID=A0A9X0CC30_9EURO|nr:hypothetical protein N7463_001473 [Penicillium fimorum]